MTQEKYHILTSRTFKTQRKIVSAGWIIRTISIPFFHAKAFDMATPMICDLAIPRIRLAKVAARN